MTARISRRRLLAGTAATVALAPLPALAQAAAAVDGNAVSATDFGLRPGDDDQSEALARAVAAAAGAGRPLSIPAGTYVASGIELPGTFTVFGVRGATRLVSRTGAPVFSARGVVALTIRDLGFGSGGTADFPGVLVFADASDLILENLDIVAGLASGLHLERCSGRIAGAAIRDCADTGIFALDSAGLAVTGNRIAGCGNGGIRIWASAEGGHDGTIVAFNDVRDIRTDGGGNGQNGNGINVFRANGVTVNGNHLTGCAFSAIRLNATNDTVVSGNTCLDSGEVAIFSEFGFSGSVIADNIVDGAAQGISMTNFDAGGRLATCTGNVVRNIAPQSLVNPDTTPAGIFAEADAVIASNVVDSVPGLGIGAGWGPYLRDVAVTGNLVRDVEIGIGVSVAEGAGAANISGNLVSGAARAGIAGLAWADMVSDDLARDAARFPNVTLGGNRVS